MAKVIAVDNYGRESVADRLVAQNLSLEAAETLAKENNEKGGVEPAEWCKVVPDDHRLWRGMADLV